MESTSLQKPDKSTNVRTQSEFKREIVWKNVFAHLVLHLMGLYGLYVYIVSAKLLTWVYVFLVFLAGGAGVTIAAHRYFTHRSFKATFGLRCLFMALFVFAGENSIYVWVRDHRQHHKYSDTDADPHNSSRGFFFSHCGWLMMRKHPEVIEKGKTIDLSDLEADPVVRFQEKYYILLYIALNTLAVALPCLLWGESLQVSFWTAYALRNILVYNSSWLVNSLAHFYGTKPYDKKIRAVESLIVSLITVGEGWHNFHHTFPSDYRAAEYGQIYDLTTMAIDSLESLGWAYDLRQTPQYLVNKWVKNYGDGNHPLGGEEEVPLATQDIPVEGDNDTAKFGVTLGIYNRCAIESTQRTFTVTSVVLHPNFTSPADNNDIAIMTLNQTTNYTPICLPEEVERNLTNRVGELLGFGETTEGNTTLPCTLQRAYIQIFTIEECNESQLPSHTLNPWLLCAGVIDGGVDSCQGDSGGPLQVVDNGAFVLAGIVSYGFGCGKMGYPGLYTNVYYFLDWIKENMT